MALQMIVEGGLVTGVIAPMTPKRRRLGEHQAAITRGRDGDEFLGPWRLVGDQEVLDDLVLGAAEARLFVRLASEILGLAAHDGPHRLDDQLALLEPERRQRMERRPCGFGRLVDGVEDAPAKCGCDIRRAFTAPGPVADSRGELLRNRLGDPAKVVLAEICLTHGLPVAVAVLLPVLLVQLLAADLPGVHDGHDDGIAGAIFGHFRLPRRRA